MTACGDRPVAALRHQNLLFSYVLSARATFKQIKARQIICVETAICSGIKTKVFPYG